MRACRACGRSPLRMPQKEGAVMVRRKSLLILGLLLCVAGGGRATADTLQLDLSSATNLNALTVGQTFQVDVTLSGLPGGESLDVFAANVFFNNTYLSGATSPVF